MLNCSGSTRSQVSDSFIIKVQEPSYKHLSTSTLLHRWHFQGCDYELPCICQYFFKLHTSWGYTISSTLKTASGTPQVSTYLYEWSASTHSTHQVQVQNQQSRKPETQPELTCYFISCKYSHFLIEIVMLE